jgi:hypothetical protein
LQLRQTNRDLDGSIAAELAISAVLSASMSLSLVVVVVVVVATTLAMSAWEGALERKLPSFSCSAAAVCDIKLVERRTRTNDE